LFSLLDNSLVGDGSTTTLLQIQQYGTIGVFDQPQLTDTTILDDDLVGGSAAIHKYWTIALLEQRLLTDTSKLYERLGACFYFNRCNKTGRS
jgi:hypothetical protein